MDVLFNENGAPGDGMVPAGTIRDGSTATFVADVIEASKQVPVIVDFWATWCGPCKTLGPALERAVREAKGAVRLVKIDVDQNQQLAAQMRIQSVPTVYAFQDGRPVDGFTGAVPESQIRDMIAHLTGGADPQAAVTAALDQAHALVEAGDVESASALYRDIARHDPGNGAAFGGLLRCLIQTGAVAEAKRILATLPPEVARHADVVAQQTKLDLADQAGRLGPVAQLARRVQDNPADHQSRFDLALAEFAAGHQQEAIDHLLELFRRDRGWNDEAARKQLVKLFEAMGPADPLTVSARRRLSSLMFS